MTQEASTAPIGEGIGLELVPSPSPSTPQTWSIAHSKCQTRWSSPSQAHCTMCCQQFSSGWAFERHLLGGKCQDPTVLMNEDGTRLVFKAVTRKNCNTTIWVMDNGKDDDAGE